MGLWGISAAYCRKALDKQISKMSAARGRACRDHHTPRLERMIVDRMRLGMSFAAHEQYRCGALAHDTIGTWGVSPCQQA